MTPPAMIAYSFAVLRAVPHVHLGAFVNVGVVLHARTEEFLALRAITDGRELERRVRFHRAGRAHRPLKNS